MPSAIVLVATVRALEHHGDGDLEAGMANLERHLGIARDLRPQRGRRGQRLPRRHRAEARHSPQARARARRLGGRGQPRLHARRRRRGGARRDRRRSGEPAVAPSSRSIRSTSDRGQDRRDRDEGLRRRRHRAAPRGEEGSRALESRASAACRSAWRRRTSPSRTIRSCKNAPTGFTVPCATSARTRAPAGSRALRRHADDARAREASRGVRHRSRRRRPHRRPVLSPGAGRE